MNNIPLTIIYFWYPIIGFFVQILNLPIGKERDLFWLIPPLVLLISPITTLKFNFKGELKFILFFLMIFLFKFFLGLVIYINDIQFQMMPYITEIKGWIFLLVGYLWVQRFGIIENKEFIKGGVFLSWLYVIISIFVVIRDGTFHRMGLGSETNYDGFLILMSYIACFSEKGTKWNKIILIVATFLTLSRTGLVSLIAITMYYKRSELKYWIFIVPIALFVGIVMIFFSRGGIEVDSTDRFVFWGQAFIVFQSMSSYQLLFGVIPGMPLEYNETLPMMEWFISHFEEILGIRGMHPMIFHGFWLRSALVLGIPFTVWFIYWNIKNIFERNINKNLKGISILILLQGFSMAVFHLSLIGVPLVIFLLSSIYPSSYKHESFIRSRKEVAPKFG